MHPFTLLFLAMLTLSVAVEAWLSRRHARHVAAHRDAVPEAFRDRVSLEDHQKAADYTVARVLFGNMHLAIGTAVLLAWTLGGGVAALDTAWREFAGPGLLAGTGLLVSALLIGVAIGSVLRSSCRSRRGRPFASRRASGSTAPHRVCSRSTP
jgi:STE24 endopeptidase